MAGRRAVGAVTPNCLRLGALAGALSERTNTMPDGRQGRPPNLRPDINTPLTTICPMVTPDGRYLFFDSRAGKSWAEGETSYMGWVGARIVKRNSACPCRA